MLLGREEERLAIDHLLAGARKGRSGVLALVGEAGIGKTAVVTKFARDLSDVAVDYLAARGYPAVNAASLLEGLAGTHPDEEKRAALLRQVSAPDLVLLGKLDAVLTGLEGRRVLVILDDVEQLLDDEGDLRDESLLALLRDLADRGDHHVQVVLVTTRLPRRPDAVPVEIEDGLPEGELQEFLAWLEPGDRTRALSMTTHQWSVFTRATDCWPRPAERIYGVVAANRTPLHSAIEAMGARRTPGQITAAGLDETEREAVRALAVYGRPVELDAVAELVAQEMTDRVEAALDRLADQRIVRRERAHSRVDRYFLPTAERDDFLGEPDGTTAESSRRAAEFLHRCADQLDTLGSARKLGDLEYYLDAIELYLECDDGESALDLVKKIDDCYLKGWGQTGVLGVYLAEISRMLADPHSVVLTNSIRARALLQQGRSEEAVTLILETGSRYAKSIDEETELILLNQLGTAYLAQGRLSEAIDSFLEVAESTDPNFELSSRADARYNLAVCLTEVGRFDDAAESIALATADLDAAFGGIDGSAGDDADNRRLRAQLKLQEATIARERGEYTWSVELAGEARAEALAIGAKVLAGLGDDVRAWSLLLDGGGTAAMEAAQAARRVAAQTGHPRLTRVNGVVLALLHLQRRELPDAHAAADLAVRSSHSTPGAGAYVMRGIVALRQKQSVPAQNDFTQALTVARAASDQELCDLLDFSALARAGLALAQHSDTAEDAALRTYRSAIRLADAPGAHARRRALFRELVADSPRELPRLRALLDVRAIPRPGP
jgi:tetratricopeptide (TPR) repeat protein